MTFFPNRFGAALFMSLAALAAGCGGAEKGARSAVDEGGNGGGPAEVGKPAPDLSLESLNGKGPISLEASKGKVLVVDFWATWCEPCRASFPKLEELSKRVGDKVEVVGISVDDEKKGIVEFAKENGATFAIGWDEGHTIASRWKVEKMPTTFIVDRSGKVRFIHGGYHDGETKEMEKEIASLFEDAPASDADTRVAKNDKEPSTHDVKSDSSDDAHGSSKSAPTASASNDEDEAEAAPPPPKKKAAKKAAGKGKPTKKGGKKATKKK
ncbi:MAG: TlpA family protein disulfide reductase [Myxococcales bacterium]|nr:TlpA family protein disulfide reductase [Myxococcales bacterium]